MVVTPALLGVAPASGRGSRRRRSNRPPRKPTRSRHHPSDHVVILGFGMGGQLLGRALRQLATPYVILDLNGATVRRGAEGWRVNLLRRRHERGRAALRRGSNVRRQW